MKSRTNVILLFLLTTLFLAAFALPLYASILYECWDNWGPSSCNEYYALDGPGAIDQNVWAQSYCDAPDCSPDVNAVAGSIIQGNCSWGLAFEGYHYASGGYLDTGLTAYVVGPYAVIAYAAMTRDINGNLISSSMWVHPQAGQICSSLYAYNNDYQ